MEPERNDEYLVGHMQKKEYWNQRFQQEDHYEWLVNYLVLKQHLQEILNQESQILQVGIGSSSLSRELYEDGYCNITNIDISEVLIQKRKHEFPNMEWIQMDMLNLQFEKQFDVVLDKATMDVLQCDNDDPWNPNQQVRERVRRFYNEVSRVLEPNGILVQISFDQPHFRSRLIPEIFQVRIKTVDSNTFPYFCYILKKI